MTPHIAIILAGGSGRRFGASQPKQYLKIGGRTVLEYAVDAFDRHPRIDEVAIVAHPDYVDTVRDIIARNAWGKVGPVITGGDERSDSTLSALRTYSGRSAHLLFHDAVRPLVSQRLISDVIAALDGGARAVNVVLPVVDTIVEVDGERITAQPDRSLLRRVQTPQGFDLDTLNRAYRRAVSDPEFRATDDCGVVARYLPETDIVTVRGEEENLKLTYPADVLRLEQYLHQRYEQEHEAKEKKSAKLAPAASADDPVRAYMQRNLRRMQLRTLGILCAVRDVCERHDIPYWLDSGTLLGAVRHGGFIPWDDDIDICLPRERLADFERACRDLPPHLFLQTRHTDPSLRLPTYKVRDTDSFIVESGDDLARPYRKGFFVDIFPMEAWPSLPDGFTRRVARGYCRANAILHAKHYYSLRSVAELFYFTAKRAVMRAAWAVAGACVRHDEYYSNIILHSGNGNRHRRDTIFPLTSIDFEGERFSAPADPDRYLRDLFGDYRVLPPEEGRTAHAVFFCNRLTEE